jgi:LysR family glycine cleavage system transcriptional activator
MTRKPRRLPPLNAQRAFEAAARHESFVAAASELRVTPAAISRHIKLLEARLREQLFERRQQSLKLTQFGHSLLPTVSEALDIIIEMGTQRLQNAQRRGKIVVSAQTAFATGSLLPRLDRLYREQPEVELCLYTHTEQPSLAADSRLDGAITLGHGDCSQCELHFIFANRLIPVCIPSYLSRHPYLIQPSQLISENLIVAETSASDWLKWFAHVGIKVADLPRRPVFPTGFLPAQTALNGIGIALADRLLIEADLQSGRVIAPISAPPLVRGTGWYFVHPKGRPIDEPMQRWISWLKREAALHLNCRDGESVAHA